MDPKLSTSWRASCLICRTLRRAQSQTQRSQSIARQPLKCLSYLPQTQQRRRASTRAATSSQTPRNQDAPQKHSSSHKVRKLSSNDTNRIQGAADKVLQHPGIPMEEDVSEALSVINNAAKYLIGVKEQEKITKPASQGKNPASGLLSLDSTLSQAPPTPTPPPSDNIDFLSNLAYDILEDPCVFITPEILTQYVNLQSLLNRPDSLPTIFSLYATKPTPFFGKDGFAKYNRIAYRAQKQNAISTAIPTALANTALDTAIRVRHLSTALGILETTFAATSYRRSKIFRQALPPLAIFALFPVACYSLATTFSNLQTSLPPEDFTMYAFAGLTTYIAAVSSLGYVALTTRNDQMERVTWYVGMSLHNRWIREEERAAGEKIAKAWGHRRKEKWGEEEGAEWMQLKDWLGVRGMVLDKVGLMEGME